MRYLGLDVGTRNIGVAVGETLAAELTTLTVAKEKSFYSEEGQELAAAEIEKLMKLEEADALVVGLPVDEAGRPTEESEKIRRFCAALQERLGITIHFVDETLTSFMAEEMLSTLGFGADEIRERIHQAAAQLILQQYLEENER